MAANAKRGLQYEATKEVIDRLIADGGKLSRITYRDILQQTGTGSLETIGDHLRRYRLEYIEAVAEDDVDPAELEDLRDPIRNIVARKLSAALQRRDREQEGEREQAEIANDNLALAVAENDSLNGEVDALREVNRTQQLQIGRAAVETAALQGRLDEAHATIEDLVAKIFAHGQERAADDEAVRSRNMDPAAAALASSLRPAVLKGDPSR